MSLDQIRNGIADPRELASRLRQRITFQEPVETPDGAGGYTRSFSDVATVWAEMLPYAPSLGGERLQGRQLQEQVTHRVLIRYRADITTAMRIYYAGRYFNIRSVINVNEANVLLHLLAEEGVAT